jgi:cellulose synthase/poly-beta-1,6-N-acetylglucosamine synthase-like glycosyltransferase
VSGLALLPLASVALTAVTAAFFAAGCIAASFALYLVALSIGAFFYSERSPGLPPSTRIAVLIPAHNEGVLIARCVRSLCAQTYPSDLFEVVVVADNCSDETASIAAHAGAHRVMVRDEPADRGKGQALRWAIDRLIFAEPAPAAIVIVDADSVAAADLLTALVRRFEAGAQAVQGEYLLSGDGTIGSELRVSAFLLVNRVRPAGRAVLGLSTHLMGNGMLLSRDLLLAVPWTAFTSTEDLEYSLDLAMSGVKIAFAGDARVRAPTAPNPQAAAQQQLRWDGGKAYLVRTRLPGLVAAGVRQRRPALLEMAFSLAIPPLGLLAAIVLLALAVDAPLTATHLERGGDIDSAVRPDRAEGWPCTEVGIPCAPPRAVVRRHEVVARPPRHDLPRTHLGANRATRI